MWERLPGPSSTPEKAGSVPRGCRREQGEKQLFSCATQGRKREREMSYVRKHLMYVVVLLLIAACSAMSWLAPAFLRRATRLILSPFGMAFQLSTVLFSFLPALGLGWFAWHLLLQRRVRLRKLRRVRIKQGRTKSLLAPPPVFGAACREADHAVERHRPE